MSLAKLYEEKYQPVNSNRAHNYSYRYFPISAHTVNFNSAPSNAAKNTIKTYLPPLLPTPNTPPLRNNSVKKISLVEMQLWREKGLCYFCDDKFTFNHKCPDRQMLMLQLEDDEGEAEMSFDVVSRDNNSIVETGINNPHHLSLNALKGGLGVGTIRFVAHINTLPVRVLVDGGSSNNFLQPRVAKILKLPIEPSPLFKVMVGNGNYMTVVGMIKELNLQGIIIRNVRTKCFQPVSS